MLASITIYERFDINMWMEFELQKILLVSSPKKRFNANTLTIYTDSKKGFPYVVRTSLNNGIRGYINEDERYLNAKNTFSFGQDTATVFWQPQPYFTGDKIKILTPRTSFTTETALFILIAIRKAFSLFSWGTNSFNEDIIKTTKLSLPVLLREKSPVIDESLFFHDEGYIPDFEYMGEIIKRREKESICKLENCLLTLGLNECILTNEERYVLDESKVEKEFVMHDLFEKVKAPYKGKGKKQDNVSKQKTKEFNLPLINCKDGNNGIMYYGRRDDFTVCKNVLSIIYNGPPTEGQTYYQEEIGVYTDAYIVQIKNGIVLDRQLGLYLSTAINKSIHNLEQKKYSRGNKATWNGKVENDKIMLPIQTDENNRHIIDEDYSYHPQGYIPDWDYMRSYIKAIEKIVAADVLKFKNTIIEND